MELARKREDALKHQQGPEVEEVEKRMREARRQAEVVREVAQAVIVGSGVDWSRDEELRRLVLACGEEK